MKKTATLAAIALATEMHRTTIQRKLDKAGAPFIWGNGDSGPEKNYLINNLPRDLRLALAKQKAFSPSINIPENKAAKAGVEAAQTMLEQTAIEKEQLQIAKEEGLAVFDFMPEEDKAVAYGRYDFLQACINFVLAAGYKIRKGAKHSKKGTAAFVEAYNSGEIQLPGSVHTVVGKSSSYPTLDRWRKTYDKQGLIGLVNSYHNPKKGGTSLSEEQKTFVVALITDNPTIKVTNIEKGLQGHFGFSIPSYAVIKRYYEHWIAENRMRYEHLLNPDKWKNHRMVAYGSASENITRLNELWEADSTPADLMLTDGRYNLIDIVDVYSRRGKFHVCKTSKGSAIAALIRRTIIDWGVNDALKTDNGKDYKGRYLRQVLEGLGVLQIFCKPFSGEEKPHAERFFKTFLHSLVEMMPGYIGHSVGERQAIEARRSFADRVMKKGGDPVEVNLSSEELQKICDEWTEYIYHHDSHRGLGGKKPIDMVREWKEPIRHISNMRALDMLLMQAPKDGGWRSITKKGVRVDNKYYHSLEMTEHTGKVKVLMDPTDMGTVYCYQKDSMGETRFLCIGINPEWYGINTAEFASMSKKHQAKFIKASKRELLKQAKEVGSKNAYREYMERRKAQVDNIVEMPQVKVDYTTTGLQEAERAAVAMQTEQAVQNGMENQTADITVPEGTAEVAPKKDAKVTKLIQNDTDQYQKIRDRVLGTGRKLTPTEYELLGQYYETASGKSFMILEGDFRLTVGLGEEQAEV